MDTKGFVEMLNQDLSTEYQSIVQYTNHVARSPGPSTSASSTS